jgi:hypothetical protein
MPSAFAIRRRRRHRPDDRPDWRDPSMPVWRTALMSDGSTQTMYLPPEFEVRQAEQRLAGGLGRGWRNDPTYDMRKRPARTNPRTTHGRSVESGGHSSKGEP